MVRHVVRSCRATPSALLFSFLAAGLAVPAAAEPAQTVVPLTLPIEAPKDIYRGNYLVLGVGAANVPIYEGGRQRGIYPAFGIMARYRRIAVRSRGLGLAFDVLRKPATGKVAFSLGPVIRWRGGGGGRMRDPVLARLGRGQGNLEAGINAGVQVRHVLNAYDSFSLGIDVRRDVSSGRGGQVVSIGPGYFTPVSKAQVVGLSMSADFIDSAYSRRSYGITSAGALASGLPAYQAHAGLKSVGFKAYTAYDLDGNLRDGGFAVGAAVGYTVLAGAATSSPIIQRGRRGGLLLAAGIGYAF
ncbi:MAG: MipA/OmpV family protein [Sphingomonadales bacterium]|nr:MipA/OmpV family protein [Sphingomonadales bacterium]